MNDQYEDRKSSKSQSLKQQRAIARARSMGLTESYRPVAPTQKVFNMRWICDTLDQVLLELDAYAQREPEIGSATEMIESAKRVINSYGSRVLDTPYKNYSNKAKPSQNSWGRKGNYDNFADNGGFDDASSIFQQQRDAADEEDIENQYAEVEKNTDEKLRSQGVEPCRDDKGHFTDC